MSSSRQHHNSYNPISSTDSRYDAAESLYKSLDAYIRTHPVIPLEHILDKFEEYFAGKILGSGTEWLEELLCNCIWNHMEYHYVELSTLFIGMVRRSQARYESVIHNVLLKIHDTALTSPSETWEQYCILVGQFIHDVCNAENIGLYPTCPVIGILIDTFASDKNNPDISRQRVVGAAKCVCMLGTEVIANVQQTTWMSPSYWGRKKEIIKEKDWINWIWRLTALRDELECPRDVQIVSDALHLLLGPRTPR
ncbi:hypothetical protein F5Y09DRAFT_340977 [Xylaria sp. FL1042]|nr:hypothetical protein F5Y09DRAFT_340977 [Xylaria sp. FL1042]